MRSLRVPPSAPPPEGPVLFFDERCSVCRRFVAWALAADHTGMLRLARLDGPRARRLQQDHPELAARDSALWVAPGPTPGRPLRYADAILATLAYLGGAWGIAATLGRMVPRFLRDAIYRSFARHRSLFGWLGLPELSPEMRRRLAFENELPSRSFGDTHPSTHRSA